MQTRTLGRTDVVLSEISLGTWGLAGGAYGPVPPERLEATVKEAFDRGVTTFDLAPLWGDGEGERAVATALGEERLKDATFVVRAGYQLEGGRPIPRFESQALLESVVGSLERLGRDHIDVLLLHDPPLKVLQSEMFRKGLDHLLESGKVRAWGAAVSTVDEARLLLKLGASAVGLPHHMLEPHVLYTLATTLDSFGAGVIVRSPLAYGMLSGRFGADHVFAEDDHRSRRWDADGLRKRVARVEELRTLVREPIPDLATLALRFALWGPAVATVAVGARTPEQIAHAAAASTEPPHLPKDLAVQVRQMLKLL
jgi:aryl-alcohol dehydrogenase-like predicted oxidoreductase